MRLLLLCFLAGALAAEPAPSAKSTPASATTANVSVGGRTVSLPYPAGYSRIDGQNADVDKALQAQILATNRLVAFFGLNSEWELARGGLSGSVTRTHNVQVLRAMEQREVGIRDFADAKKAMAKEVEGMEKSTAAALERLGAQGKKVVGPDGVESVLKVNEFVFLGRTLEDSARMGYTMAFKVNLDRGNAGVESRAVVSMMFLTANGRFLMAYANAPYGSEQDRQWCEKAVADWSAAIIAANPRVEGGPRGFSWERASQAGLVGGIVGLIASVVFTMLRKKQKDETPSGPAA